MTDAEPLTPAHPPPVVVTLPAEIDMATADGVYEQIGAEFARGAQAVIADMTATTFCDTLGARTLVLASQQAAAADAELRLLRPSPRVMRVWTILGVDAVLPIYHSLDEALSGQRRS